MTRGVLRELRPLLMACLWPLLWLAGLVALPFIPGMAAAVIAFGYVFIIPGLAILMAGNGRWSLSEAVVLSTLLGGAQLALLSLPALLIHLPLIYALVPHVATTILFAYIALRRRRASVEITKRGMAPPAGALLLIAALFVTAGDDIARGGDNWQTMPFVASFAAGQDMNENNPTFDTGRPVLGRYVFNVFAVQQAGMVELAGLDVVSLNLSYLPLIALALGGLGVYALTVRLSGEDRVGYLAVGILAFAVLSDLSAQEGYGISYLIRAGEDKFFAAFVLFPAFGLLCMSREKGLFPWLMLLLGSAALTLTHPFGAAFAGLGLAAVAIGSGLEDRRAFLPACAGVGAILVLLAVPAIYQRFLVDDLADFLFEGTSQTRIDLRRLDLPGPLLILHPAMVTQPLMWLAILVSPLLVLRLADPRARAFIAVVAIALPLGLFFPPTATVLARVASPGLLWRFLMIIPMAPILALALSRLSLPPARVAILAVAAAVLTLVFIETQSRVSDDVYLARSEDSVVLGGIENGWGGNSYWRDPASDRLREVSSALDDRIEGEAVVLVPPSIRSVRGGNEESFLDLSLPVLAPELDSYTDRRRIRLDAFDRTLLGLPEGSAQTRQVFSNAFYGRRFPPMIRDSALFADRSVTHVLVARQSYQHERLRTSRSFQNLGALAGGYVLFEFVPGRE